MASDAKSVIGLVTPRLLALGFRKAASAIFTRAEAPDVLAWVGLNHAKRGGFVEINPVVGVRHQGVERLVAELLGEDFDEVAPPTAAANVGYVSDSDRYEAFIFDGSRRDEEIASELAGAVAGPGTAFVARNSTLDNLANTLSSSTRLMPEQTAYRLPAALFLLHRFEDSGRALESKVRDIGSRTDPAATRYLSFAKRLGERM